MPLTALFPQRSISVATKPSFIPFNHPSGGRVPSVLSYISPREFREFNVESGMHSFHPLGPRQSLQRSSRKRRISVVKVDAFFNKLERYLRARHGLDLEEDGVSDYILEQSP